VTEPETVQGTNKNRGALKVEIEVCRFGLVMRILGAARRWPGSIRARDVSRRSDMHRPFRVWLSTHSGAHALFCCFRRVTFLSPIVPTFVQPPKRKLLPIPRGLLVVFHLP
jgi:hypothetical protein